MSDLKADRFYREESFWKVNKAFQRNFGDAFSITMAVIHDMFRYCDRTNQLENDGSFFLAQEKIREKIGYDVRTIRNHIEIAKKEGLLDVKRRGLPARNYYKINFDNMYEKGVITTKTTGTRKLNKTGRNAPILTGCDPPVDKNRLNEEQTFNKTERSDKSERNDARSASSLSLSPPPSVKIILDFWNSSGLRKHQDPNTKVYRDVVKVIKSLLRGKAFENRPMEGYKTKRWTVEEITKAIERFSIAANDPQFRPTNKERMRKTSFTTFVWNDYFPENPSHLVYYHNNEPEPFRLMNDENPEITLYFEKVLREKGNGNGQMSRQDKMKLVSGAERLMRFWEAKKGHFVCSDILLAPRLRSAKGFASIFVESVLQDCGEDAAKWLQPGKFCSNFSFGSFEKYLKEDLMILQ